MFYGGLQQYYLILVRRKFILLGPAYAWTSEMKENMADSLTYIPLQLNFS